MALTKALNGFRPSRIKGNGPNSNGQSEYTIASGLAQNIFYGDIVTFNAGNIETVTTIGIANDVIAGVFAGCAYTEDGEPKWKRYWPSGTSASDIVAYVYDDMGATFSVQADASVTAGDVYSTTFTVTLGTGSTFTGNSGHGLRAAGRGDDGQLTVLGPFREAGNSLVAGSNAFPRVEVLIKQNVDVFPTVGVSAGTVTV